MTFHKSGPGRGPTAMSYACALSSIVFGYEVLVTLAHVALKSNNNSKSMFNLSKMTFPDNDCCISLNLLEYRECLVHCQLDNNKFGDMTKSLSGKIILDKLTSDFELLFDFKAACTEVLEASYTEMMELKAQAYYMVVTTLPGPDLWKVIQQYGSTKFKMHL